ncbi:MAG: DNA gyrase inhibitor YacG [Methyloceanibacter sp.]|nr:DNA gyrase inhibitor YacG [Methyloceanibacter sp.]
MSGAGNVSKVPKAVSRCPICRKPTVKAHRPFCSKRCAEIDLGRWLKGGYVVPGDPAAEDLPGISPDGEQD